MVETSPGNFSGGLKHGEPSMKRAAYGREAARPKWRQSALRLAGFTIPKPIRRLASGLQPFARLLEASGQVYARRTCSSQK